MCVCEKRLYCNIQASNLDVLKSYLVRQAINRPERTVTMRKRNW